MVNELSQFDASEPSSFVQGIVDVVSAVRKHNEEYSAPSMISGVFLKMANEEPSDRAIPMKEEQGMARDVLGVSNMDVLADVGITLSPPKKDMITPIGDQIDQVGKVQFQLIDGSKLSAFLQDVDIDVIDDTARDAIEKIIQDIVNEAYETIEDREKTPTLEVLAYSKGIINGLTRIGLGDANIMGALRGISEHVEQGDVKEWISAREVGLIGKKDGVENWIRRVHQDASPERLSEFWQKVIDVIKSAKENPKAEKLVSELIAKAREDLEYATSDWERMKDNEEYKEALKMGYGEGFEAIFEKIRLELDLLES